MMQILNFLSRPYLEGGSVAEVGGGGHIRGPFVKSLVTEPHGYSREGNTSAS